MFNKLLILSDLNGSLFPPTTLNVSAFFSSWDKTSYGLIFTSWPKSEYSNSELFIDISTVMIAGDFPRYWINGSLYICNWFAIILFLLVMVIAWTSNTLFPLPSDINVIGMSL